MLATAYAVLFTLDAEAHCPLCTAGAALAAGGALWLGVSRAVVALFVGAFAVSVGIWISNLIKRRFVPFQKEILILLSFVTTVLPLVPLMRDGRPFHVSISGDYGSLLNNTYIVNLSLVASVVGGLIVIAAPLLSRWISRLRDGKMIPFQGILLTFVALIAISVLIQLL